MFIPTIAQSYWIRITWMKKIFKQPEGRVKQFEARWLKEETVIEIVKASWEKAKLAGIGPSLVDRTRALHADLHT